MSLLELYLRAPNPETLYILKLVLGLTVLLHLPYLGLLIGSTVLSLKLGFLARSDKRAYLLLLSKDLFETFAVNKYFVFVLGIVPLPIMISIYAQILYGVENSGTAWLGLGAVLLLLSYIFLYFYKHTLGVANSNAWFNQLMGWIGLFLLLGGTYHYFAAASLYLYPEKWKLIHDPVWMMFTSNTLIRMTLFVIASVGFTAVSALYFFFGWPGIRQEDDEVYKTLAGYLLGGIGVATSLVLPLFLLWDMVLSPVMAKNALALGTYVAGAVIVLVVGNSMINLLFKVSKGTVCSCGLGIAFFAYILFFVNWAVLDYSTREWAIQEHTKLLTVKAEERALLAGDEEEALLEAEMKKNQKIRHVTPWSKPLKKWGAAGAPAGELPVSGGHGAASHEAPAHEAPAHAAAMEAPAHEAPAAESHAAPAESHAAAPAAAEGFTAAQVSKGKKLNSVKGCVSCHSSDGSKIVGPTFKGIWGAPHSVTTDGVERTVTMDLEFLTRSIRQPNADIVVGYPPVMPAQDLTDEEILAVAAFLDSLK